jgi:GT2 family glycosyltransferase
LPARWRAWRELRRTARRVAASGWFDAAWYRATYPDVADAADPALHYLRRGAAEGRSPGPRFDGPAYVRRHPDVLLQGVNPLLHFLDTGARDATPVVAATLPAMALTDANYRRWIAAHEARIAGGELGEAFVLLQAPFVRLRADAVAAFARALAADPGLDALYADEDRLDARGERGAPLFKPPWDADLFAERDLIGGAVVIRRDRLVGNDPWAAVLHVARHGGRVGQVPEVLFHALPDAPPRRTAPPVAYPWPASPPLVSVIVPTRDRAALLAACAAGVLKRTDYPVIELLIVDNDSREPATARLFAELLRDERVRVLRHAGAFNWSAMNNHAARAARGDVLVLLNNDIDVIEPGWLAELVGQALRPEVGAVGAKLLYPNATVQHAGMTLGRGSFGAHLFRGAARDDPGYAGMLSARRRVSAVTGACVALRRDVFAAVGGIEETHLRVTGSDLDLCLRVRERGLGVLFTPHAVLFHRELASRGLDVSPAQRARVAAERVYLLDRWGAAVETEAFLSPSLTVVGEGLALSPCPVMAAPDPAIAGGTRSPGQARG